MKLPRKILVVTPYESDSEWQWLTHHFQDDPIEWTFRNLHLYGKKYPVWLPPALRAAREARDYDLVISHQPYMTLYLSLAMRLQRVRVPHWGASFNQGDKRYFRGMHGWIARRILQDVDLIVTYSDNEREIYSSMYGIPMSKFAFSHWTSEPPKTDLPAMPDVSAIGPYICCLGRNNRDFGTLLQAVKDLPLKLVLVCPPEAVANFSLPSNVIVRSNLSMDECMSILAGSLFSVVPIQNASTGAGHITMVAAMQLAKAQIVTAVPTIKDYFIDGEHGILVDRGSVQSLRSAIVKLLESESLRQEMGARSLRFANQWFSESAGACSLRHMLMNWRQYQDRPANPPGWQPTLTQPAQSG